MSIKLLTTGILLTISLLNPLKIEGSSPELAYEYELTQWVERLAQDESNHNEDIKVLDVNNKYSYGCLQFQLATWQSMSKKYGVTGDIMSCQAQKELARAMIKDDWNNWRHWYTSVTTKTAGYPPKNS